MLQIIFAQPLPFIIAILIGLATAWWVWGRAPEAGDEEFDYCSDDEAIEETPVGEPVANEPEDNEPVMEEPVVVEPEEVDPVETVSAAPVVSAAASAAAVKSSAPKKVDVDATPVPLSVAEIENRPNIAAAVGDPDDLKRIKGIGPKLEDLCNSLGVSRFDQIAEWRAKDIAEVDAHLGSFRGRITRDRWVDQAKLLAEGKVTQHAAEFGD